MYKLSYFKEKNAGVVMDFIRQHPFAFVSGCDEQHRPVVTQVPLFIEERNGKHYLSGHMMRKTDHATALAANPQVLCVFSGPHAYVSATWYTNPHQASTWNYMSVHVRGEIRFLGEAELIDVLRKTSLHFEGGNTASSTVYDNLSEDYRGKLIHAIVAFEVEVESIETTFKLSQNRDQESFESIIHHLSEGDSNAAAVALEMKKRTSQLYPS